MATEQELSHTVIGLAMSVHTQLGPGLLEHTYKECLCYKLRQAGLQIEKEKPIPLTFEGVNLDCGYRMDLLVEDKLALEVKSVEYLNDIHMPFVDVLFCDLCV